MPTLDRPFLPPISSPTLLKIVGSLTDKKAVDIRVLDVRGVSSFTDFMVICSGTSSVHVQSLVSNVRDAFKNESDLVYINPSRDDSWWVLDFVDVVLHVFKEEVRSFYDLEHLWEDATLVTI